MKRFLFAFSLGACAGAVGLWHLEERLGPSRVHETPLHLTESASQISTTVQNAYSNITSEAIREELALTGIVVREKVRQASLAIRDAAANAQTTAAIKTKLFMEPNLPAMTINVDTTGGLVTLSGTVDSPEQVARAVRLALATDGVHKVVSTLQVHPQH